jgi:hypothetical protein
MLAAQTTLEREDRIHVKTMSEKKKKPDDWCAVARLPRVVLEPATLGVTTLLCESHKIVNHPRIDSDVCWQACMARKYRREVMFAWMDRSDGNSRVSIGILVPYLVPLRLDKYQ